MDDKENSRAASLLLRRTLTDRTNPAAVGTPLRRLPALPAPPANNSDGPSPVFSPRLCSTPSSLDYSMPSSMATALLDRIWNVDNNKKKQTPQDLRVGQVRDARS
jgi:hypothetical protein